VTFYVAVDMEDVIKELDRLARGPGADGTTFRFESIWLEGFAATQARVHVLTGRLKSTGHPVTSSDGDSWTGEVDYTRYPGIFELARGNRPTLNHPEGGHYFLAPMYDTNDAMQEACLDFLRGEHG
jgi:hypothetical protein